VLLVGVGVTLTILNNNFFQIETNIKSQHPIHKQLIFSGGQTDPTPTPHTRCVYRLIYVYWVGVGVTLTILNNNFFQIETNIKTQHPIHKQLIFSGGQTDPTPTPHTRYLLRPNISEVLIH
jgi:hypothetical protein